MEIYLGNSWLAQRKIKMWSQSSQANQTATGLTAVVSISATPDGPPIHADLTATMTESPAGVYGHFFSGSVITAHLAAYAGQTVYERVVVSPDYTAVEPLIVVATRLA